MNQPVRTARAWPITPWRVIAIAAFIAAVICGFVLLAGHLTPDQIKTWAAAGIIASGIGGLLLIVP